MKSKAVYNYIKEQHTQEECSGFIDGYEKCEEDMADKKYTEEDIRKAILLSATSDTDFIPDRCDEIINSLNKQD